jgi:hypothetical protein
VSALAVGESRIAGFIEKALVRQLGPQNAKKRGFWAALF